jgi:hypothetical protein
MLNMGEGAEDFAIPGPPGIGWGLAIDTARDPSVIDPPDGSSLVDRYPVQGRSVVVLEGRRR